MPHRKHEPVRDAKRPHVEVPAPRRELPSIAAHEPKIVAEVIIHPELEHVRVHSRKIRVHNLAGVILLNPRDQLDAPHLVVPDRHLAQPVRRFNPVAASGRIAAYRPG